MEKLKQNPRLIVAALITAGVVALLVSAGGNGNDSKSTDEASQTASTEQAAVESTATEPQVAANAEVTDPIGSEPSAGPVAVSVADASYQSTVRPGDNQTVIARQIVNNYLRDKALTLQQEKRLYMETVLVDSLPRNDLIYSGATITLSEELLSQALDESNALTEAQIIRWSRYL